MFPTLPSATVYPGVEAPDVAQAAPVAPLPDVAARTRPLRWLDFDIENRPLSYWYDDRCTAEVTAIAWAVCGSAAPANVRFISTGGGSRQMLEAFVRAYDDADGVTGHYIRKHDLPIINGALVEHGLAPLRPKLTSDTRLDLIRWKDLPASQEALGAMLGLEAPKEKMSQADWRDANRLTASGIAGTCRRVVGDVEQHMELRAALLERGLLKAPRMWRP